MIGIAMTITRIRGLRRSWMNSLISIRRMRSIIVLLQLLSELRVGENENDRAPDDEQRRLQPEDRQSDALEVDAFQQRHEISRRDDVRQDLNGPRHVVDR